MHEFLRVLRPGGFVALRDAVIDAWWLRGPEADLRAAAFPLLQAVTRSRGGDWNRGRVTGDLLREAGFVRILPSASYNSSGQGFENPPMGVGFAGMLTEIRDSIVTAGDATPERVDDVISAWRRFGEHPADFFASAAGEVIGWKADD